MRASPPTRRAEIDLDAYIEKKLYFIGTSGSTLEDMKLVLRKVVARQLDTNLSVAAVSGLDGAIDGIRAVEKNLMPGKIVVYPSCRGLKLTALTELGGRLPLSDGHWNKGVGGGAGEAISENMNAQFDRQGSNRHRRRARAGRGHRRAAGAGRVPRGDRRRERKRGHDHRRRHREGNRRRVLGVKVDVTKEAEVEALFERTAREFGRVDIVVVSAAILIAEPIAEADAEKWRAVMNVNLFGYFLVTNTPAGR